MEKIVYKRGRNLKIGDIVEFWFGRDTITNLKEYIGPLSYLWEPPGAKLADLAISKVGITIEPQMIYKIVKVKR